MQWQYEKIKKGERTIPFTSLTGNITRHKNNYCLTGQLYYSAKLLIQ